MKKLFIIGLLLVTLGINAQSLTSDEIVISPAWTAQAQFAGLYVADMRGFYKEAGLNVRILHPTASSSCVNNLKNGNSQIVILHLVEALKEIDEGLHLVNIMQISQNSSQLIVSHQALNGVESLKGKRMGVWKAGFSELVYLLNKKYDLNMELVPFVNNVNLYISGAVDCTLAMSYNEYYQMIIAGLHVSSDQLLYMMDIGYNVPEDGLYVTSDYYKTHRNELQKFIDVTRKGWEWAANHPDETLDIVMQAAKQYGIKTNRVAQKWMLKNFMDAMIDNQSGVRTFQLNPLSLDFIVNELHSNEMIKNIITYKQITEP